MRKIVFVLELFIYSIIGAISGRAIAHKDWITLIMAIILFVLVLFFELVRDTCFEEKDNGHEI